MQPRLCILLIAGLLCAACGSDYRSGDFARDYRRALDEYPGAPVRQAWAERFIDTYDEFMNDDFADRLDSLYASELFFNDTLHTHHQRSSLIDYLENTAERLESLSLEVLDVRIHDRDLYLRWIMHTKFRAGWRDIEAETIGISHLRFNKQGRVILHQDFWDSRQGVFEHIPVMGGLIEWIRSGL